MQVIVTTLLVALISAACGFNYEGYKVYKVVPKTKTDAENEFLRDLSKHEDFDFWTRPNRFGHPLSIMVAPKRQAEFEQYLISTNIEYQVLIKDVRNSIEAEKAYHRLRPTFKSGRITFEQYYRHAEINAYLEQLAEEYPDTVTLDTLGQSYEEREMSVVRISSGPRDPPKPVIFVDGGIHAREWIAPAFALYIINQLVENPDNSQMIQDVDWVILPVLNPDGYEYSWDEDRLWRKTVSPNEDESCNGTDANRNFDFHWMESGASQFECAETYAGPEAFSEIESRNLRDFLLKTENVQAYLTLHSDAQCLLYPWGYDTSVCENWEELDALATAMANAIKEVRGTEFFVGGAGRDLYPAAGGSDDWSRGVAGIEVVYTMELPGGGDWGFDLPPEEIQGVVEECFEGIRVFEEYVARRQTKKIQ